MKIFFKISFAFYLFLSFHNAFAFQQEKALERSLENFVITTNQDFYLAGDRLWFAMKLMRNHEDYLYSKLAYVEIYDSEQNKIYNEKILLDPDRLAYGDMILPENANSGLYTLFIYTKWMNNFEDFPVSKKQFLVKNPSIEGSETKPVVYFQSPPFKSAKLSLFHTSLSSENIEVLDKNGKSIEILEEVAGMEPYYSLVPLDQPLQVIFQNQKFEVLPSPFWWDPSEYTLEKNGRSNGAFQVVTHNDWEIIEQLDFSNNSSVSLSKERHLENPTFKISVLDENGALVWMYEHQQAKPQTGNVSFPNSVEVGKGFQINFQGFGQDVEQAVLWAKIPDPQPVVNMMRIINDPNWKRVDVEETQTSLASALMNQTNNYEMEYVPMLVYKPWEINFKNNFKNLFRTDKIDIEITEYMMENEINRKVFHEHFGQAEKVSGLSSPFIPDISYVIDEYLAFENLETFLREIVVQTRFRKNRKENTTEIRILDTTDDKVNFKRKPILLVDFYEVKSVEELSKIELHQLDRIEVYYDRNTIDQTNLGEPVGSGMLAFFTKNNDYALKNNLRSEQYLLKDVKVSRKPPVTKAPERFQQHAVNLFKPQFFNPKVKFYRGKAKNSVPYLDYPADLLLESWIFSNDRFEVHKKTIKVL
ncbi:hypothetical protein MM213_11690 [Belliella sp. R4-6]|uniref:MG2 domain protein n=1 Tax=Belliella alkalica TaxID=1730871 RepID=A0ABS9VCI7_9BACT|nr:hypothetical protein [Belliella alkalica]MCH7414153.1 hypothetical protein [Belliella alkalica]